MSVANNTAAVKVVDFVNSIGVCTHIPYTDGLYVQLSTDIVDLDYIGITNVRDGLSDGMYGSAPLSSFITLAQHGIKFTIVAGAGGNLTITDIQNELGLVSQVNSAVPGSIVAVEGLNEINNAPVTYNGISGLQGAENYQADLYHLVHSDPTLQGVKVDYFTGYDLFHPSGIDPSVTSGYADADTQHPYPQNGSAPASWVSRTNTLPNETNPVGAAVYTETGYSTNNVSQIVQEKYSLDLLMDSAKQNIQKTYLYQLLDAYKPNSPQGDDGYGLFDPNGNPKLIAVGLHNLTSILHDQLNVDNFTTNTLNYSLTNLPATGNSLLLQKSSGAFDIVVWNEPEIWNPSTFSEISAPTTNVVVNLPAVYATVQIYDPTVSGTSIQTLHNINQVSVALTDHPIIVEVEPGLGMISAPTNGSIRFTDIANHHFNLGSILTGSDVVLATTSKLDQTITQTVGSNHVDTIYTPVWNDVRILNLVDNNGNSYATNGFLEVDASLSGANSGSLLLTQAKRGIISLTGGNYNVIVNAHSDNADHAGQHLNDFVFNLGTGNNSVQVNGFSNYTNVIFNGGSGVDKLTVSQQGILHYNGGSGTGIIHSNASENNIIFGTGKTDVWGGGIADHFTYHTNSGIAVVENFDQTKNSTLAIDSALKPLLSQTTVSGDTILQFSDQTHQIVLHAISNFDTHSITWL